MRLLNLGCGARTHPAFVNVDHLPLVRGVLRADLRRPLRFPSESFDAVYASHVLEHLPREAAARLLSEMRRVLKPRGVVRVVVPDLERSAREYLAALEDPDPDRYRWAVIELVDQLARDKPGGEMAPFIAAATGKLREHIERRVGKPDDPAPVRPPLFARVRAALPRLRGAPAAFAASGERHLWMYDRRSLRAALLAAGFEHPKERAFDESAIAGLAESGLDGEGGRPRKPDSLYMEAERA